jgi:hypothetical protein
VPHDPHLAELMPVALEGRRGFVKVNADDAIEAGLSDWIRVAARYVGALPVK